MAGTNATQTQTPTPTQTIQIQMDDTTSNGSSVNNNQPTAPQNIIVEPTTSRATDPPQPDDTTESLDTVELKEHESVRNDDVADNNDVINVYSSGDEGLYTLQSLYLFYEKKTL